MSRREFPKPVYAQIVKRALHPQHGICCEGSGLVLGKKPYHVDHTIPDALQIDKSRKLTAEDGKLLGVECCHRPKTAKDVAAIAEAKRREEKYLGMKRPVQKIKSAGFAQSEKALKRRPKPSQPPRPLYREQQS
ncbi:hypothetical protein ACLE20_13200 [Rhizobium sp. YIM 134829]|uniref:hypothetical protein n=1 Tax=Rhizobium sp. YIM 134829 TaxID=3390453 RepID=UPI0039795FFC